MRFKLNSKSVAMYIIYLTALVFLNRVSPCVPFSLGLYFSMLACGTNIIVTPVLYALASIAHFDLFAGLISLFEASFLCLIVFIYRRSKKKLRLECVAYLALALAPYIAFGNWTGPEIIDNGYIIRGICSGAVILFTFFSYKTVYAILFRTMRYRLKEDELLCCAVTYAVFGAGLYNVAGFFIYTAISAMIIIWFVRLCASPSALIFPLVLALPPSLMLLSPEPMTAYLAISVIGLLFRSAGRFASPSACLLSASAYLYFKDGFECTVAIMVLKIILLVILCLLPCIPSAVFMKKLKDRLLVKEVLQDTAIERTRRKTSEKLYRISEVFREIECAFSSLDEDIDDDAMRSRMLEDIKDKCCKLCDKRTKCAKTNVYSGFKKLIDAGCVKGKVNLIDLPSEITVNCGFPAEVMNKLNVLLAEYRRFMLEADNARSGRILLADQAHGVADVMKSCAVELCKSYGEYSAYEEQIKIKLSTAGISCPEVYVSGENTEVNATVCGRADIGVICEILESIFKKKFILKDKICFDNIKSCLIFCPPPRLDAVFGVAYAIKKGEKVSGDTHSVIKINEHSFLMALSDGMGSGEYAQKVSATAISLIEAFYKAEMPEGTVLKTINKLLSFNREERFTCIDIVAVNLNTGLADFVKIGSPAGIIVRDGEIKVLESNSLPLGIIDNLKPTVCTEQLKSGDIVVFMSDGITSAFPSSTELYEFLQGMNPLNPQNFADKILAGAKSRIKEINDDMTVVCTRIF